MKDKEVVMQYQAGVFTGVLEIDDEYRVEVGIDHRVRIFKGDIEITKTAAPVLGQQVTIYSDNDGLVLFFGAVCNASYSY